MMDMYGPVWLRGVFWICFVAAAYKLVVLLLGAGDGDMMFRVFIPLLILTLAIAVLWKPVDFLWMLFWDLQDDLGAGFRAGSALLVAAGAAALGLCLGWRLWTFSAEDPQFFLFYWWDSVCIFSIAYALNVIYERSTEDTYEGDSVTGATMITLAALLGAGVSCLAGLIAAAYMTESLVDQGLYLFVFFTMVVAAYAVVVLPLGLLRQAAASWRHLREATPGEQRTNHVLRYSKAYAPMLSVIASWFVGLWTLGALMKGDAGGGSSNVIVMVNGVTLGQASEALGGPVTELVATLLLAFIAAILFMVAATGIAGWIVPLKRQKETSRQDDAGSLWDRIFLITRAAAEANPPARKTRFKVVASCVFVVLVLLSAASFGINEMLVAAAHIF